MVSKVDAIDKPKYIDKECKYHGITSYRLEIKNKQGGSQYRCVKCSTKRKVELKHSKKEVSLRLFDGKCSICGYSKCSDALEFHHLDPSKKDMKLSYMHNSRSKETIKEELEKCILLCANCHREVHAKVITL